MFRVLLFLLFFASSVFARIGEPYADYARRVGKALEDHASEPVYDRVTLHQYAGRQVWVSIRGGIIRAEQHTPVEPRDVRAILEEQARAKMLPIPGSIPGLTYFQSPDKARTAIYAERHKRLNIYDNEVQLVRNQHLATQPRKKQIAQSATPANTEVTPKEKSWGNLEAWLLGPWNTWTFLIFVGFAIALLFVAFSAYYAFAWLSLLIHEAGHYVAGKLFGWRIIEVRLGGGRMIKAVRRKGTAWYWYRNPQLGGWVYGEPKDGVTTRFRYFCFVAGGPMATALFLGLLIWACMASPSSIGSITLQSHLASGILKFAIFFESIYLFAALCPARFTNYGRQVETDGMTLWKMLIRGEAPPVPTECQRLMQNALEQERLGQKHEAVDLAQQSVRACEPEVLDDVQLYLAGILMRSGRFAEGRAIYREQLDRLEVIHPRYAAVVDQFATNALYGNAGPFYLECESELRKALAATPDAVHLKDTLAGLLAEYGREDEAAPLLHATHRRADHELAIGISAAYLSILAQKNGRARECAKYRKRAIEFLSADHPLLQRLFRTRKDPVAKLVCAC